MPGALQGAMILHQSKEHLLGRLNRPCPVSLPVTCDVATSVGLTDPAKSVEDHGYSEAMATPIHSPL